jgi:dTDP-4-amino-4,6-dideoxygalactose transaminase
VEEDSRDKLKDYLQRKGIPTMVYYPVPLHLQEAYLEFGYDQGKFPIAEQLCKKVLSLPIHTEMEVSQQHYIIQAILDFFK